MIRSCKVSINFCTDKKKRMISAILQSYRAAVNSYIKYIWNNKEAGLNKSSLASLARSRFSERYKSCALNQALNIVSTTRKSAKALDVEPSCPVLKGAALLDHKLVDVEKGKGCFDLVIRLSSLVKGNRLSLPTKKTAVINKWLSKGFRIKNSIGLSENKIIVYLEQPDLPVKIEGEGRVLGFDIGSNKLIADSDGGFYGTKFKELKDKVARRKPGSKGKLRARTERTQYINKVVKNLDWNALEVAGFEDLTGIKQGKKKNRGKSFRKAMAPWTHRHVINRIECLTQENRVLLVLVDPANTSRTCPVCGGVSKESRKGENFRCVFCNHSGDSDTVGAQNVLARTLQELGRVVSPRLQKGTV